MLTVEPGKQRRVGHVLFAAVLLALLASMAGGSPLARAAAPVRVVGCSLASLSQELLADPGVFVVAPEREDDDVEGADQTEEDQQPKIVGTIPKPRGISEDNSRALTPLATVPKDQAIANARWAIANPDQRRIRRVAVEGENGWLVWSVKTVLLDPSSGPDPKLEVKLDAGGNGDVLSIECEPDDD